MDRKAWSGLSATFTGDDLNFHAHDFYILWGMTMLDMLKHFVDLERLLKNNFTF